MNSSRTLWMGNIEKWMDENYIKKNLMSLSIININLIQIDIFPTKLSILHKDNQKSCCFIELDSPQTALFVLENYNGLKLEDFTLKLNWVNVKPKENKKKIDSGSKKYSIYVGNVDKDISNEELKNYFKNEFPSVLFAKIIVDSNTKISKGFGFVDFGNYQDYQKVLATKTKRILKNRVLVINSAKAKREDTTVQNKIFSSNNNSITHNNFYYESKGHSLYSTNTFTSCSSPELMKVDDHQSQNKNFAMSLQKGFKDIINIYKSSIDSPLRKKPQLSLQCNYYCNLSNEMISSNDRAKQEYEELYEVTDGDFFERNNE